MKNARKIRVLIVEDSAVVRMHLEHTINNDPRLEVAACVETGEAALSFLQTGRVDVISMDIHLPGMNGLDATRRIMETTPTPIVIVSVSTRTQDTTFTMEALKVGALSVVEKPVGTSHARFAAMAERLCTQLAAMSQVKVVRQRTPIKRAAPHAPARAARHALPPDRPGPVPACIGIVASTGGPRAVSQVLIGLGTGFSVPILLVQHMTSAFLETYVAWLDQTTPATVRFAEDGQRPRPGHVYHAPPDRHLQLIGGRMEITKGPELTTVHRPSGDVLFGSMANDLGAEGLGIVLTGMGKDGAQGLLAMSRAGAHTIAEDESTAIVNGIPNAAAELGAVVERLPLHAIAPRLVEISIRRVAEAT